jgi:glycerophosphoryl diester phosphodiesterase
MTYTKKQAAETVLPAGFTVTAHSGAFGTPDNSLAFVEKVIAENCDIIEMDVSFRPDGLPVIIHSGAPKEDEGIPLAEAFARIAEHPSLRMNLDLKSTVNLPAVDALLKEYGLFDRAFYTGVGEDWVPAVQKNSAVPYFINLPCCPTLKRSRKAADAAAKRVKALGALGLNNHYNDVSPTVVRAMRENGLLISLWTANTPRAMRKCIVLCPDNITTRHPNKLRDMLK